MNPNSKLPSETDSTILRHQGPLFNLQTFAVGCHVNTAQSAARLSGACTLEVKGFRRGDGEMSAIERSITSYEPDGLLLAGPKEVKLDGSNGLEKVTIEPVGMVQNTGVIVLVDDVKGGLLY